MKDNKERSAAPLATDTGLLLPFRKITTATQQLWTFQPRSLAVSSSSVILLHINQESSFEPQFIEVKIISAFPGFFRG